MSVRMIKPWCVVVATVLVFALSACNSTPKKKPPPPKPRSSELEMPSPPREQRLSEERTQGDPTAHTGEPDEAFPEPSSDAAEIMVEEVMVEETDDPKTGGRPGADQGDASDGASGGGGAPLAGASRTGEQTRSTAGKPAPAVGPTGAGLVAPEIRIGNRSGPPPSPAPAGGSRRGLPDGQGLLEEQPEARGTGGAAPSGSGLGSTPDWTGEGNRRIPPPGPDRSVVPPDAPDDDIVARQLREAAIAEQDPVLQEKLWQEYHRYKAGL